MPISGGYLPVMQIGDAYRWVGMKQGNFDGDMK